MDSFSDEQILTLAKEMLQQNGLVDSREVSSNKIAFQVIASDGSTRRFWRFSIVDNPVCIIAAPFSVSEDEVSESKAALYIGRHLIGKGCSVPEIYGWHEDSGLLLFEDLGDTRLHSVLQHQKNQAKLAEEEVKGYYLAVIKQLAHMQVMGGEGFDQSWCWDSPVYNKETMLTRESDYFLNAFWVGMLEEKIPPEVQAEFEYLADLASEAPTDYFLHRDFQSRNIMLKENEYRFIDFQGGRLGPLGYDLASLLIDPYCGLSMQFQLEMEEKYYTEISKLITISRVDFYRQYNSLALQRNLQILGAFAFLSRVRKKPFFSAFIRPALKSAQIRLKQPLFSDLKTLRTMMSGALKRLETVNI